MTKNVQVMVTWHFFMVEKNTNKCFMNENWENCIQKYFGLVYIFFDLLKTFKNRI